MLFRGLIFSFNSISMRKKIGTKAKKIKILKPEVGHEIKSKIPERSDNKSFFICQQQKILL